MAPIGVPRSRPLPGAAPAPAGTANGAPSVSAATAGVTDEVRVAHCWGTDSIPTRAAEPAPAATPPPTWPRPPRLPSPRLAKFGLGDQAPAGPAVVPRPWNVCWPIDQPKLAIPLEK